MYDGEGVVSKGRYIGRRRLHALSFFPFTTYDCLEAWPVFFSFLFFSYHSLPDAGYLGVPPMYLPYLTTGREMNLFSTC